VDGYEEQLRRLALSDDRLLEQILGPRGASDVSGCLDPRVTALVRLGALVALGGPPAAFARAVSVGLASGATPTELVDALIAVAPIVGSALIVDGAPKLALGLGYDIEAELESSGDPPEPGAAPPIPSPLPTGRPDPIVRRG
jgi:4-carboxymuconolactone decarboxylase